MRGTSALLVRQLIAKLHPPLSGSAKDAQKLATLLQASFKRHLDEQHPAPRTEEALTLMNGPTLVNANSVSGEATQRHLQGILDHPLLHQSRVSLPVDQRAQQILAVWDQSARANTVNLPLVRTILRDYDNLGAKRLGLSSDLGRRIVAWFSTTSNKTKEKLLTQRDTISKVIPLLYESKQDEVTWEWLRLLYSGDLQQGNPTSQFDTRSVPWLNYEDHFVSCMVRESLRKRDLKTAAIEYVEACAYRSQSGRASTLSEASTRSGSLPYQPLWWTWKLLSTSILQKKKSHGVPAELYDQVLSYAVPTNIAFWIDASFLQLYRPRAPSAAQLLARLSNTVWTSSFLAWKDKRSPQIQKSLVLSMLDAAQMELDAGRTSSSSELIDFAAENFSPFVSRPKAEDLGECIDHARFDVQSGHPALAFG